jgi:hypothetical protein
MVDMSAITFARKLSFFRHYSLFALAVGAQAPIKDLKPTVIPDLARRFSVTITSTNIIRRR